MHRLLIAAAAAAMLTASVTPVLADDYPPCATRDQDHCVAQPGGGHRGWHHPVHHGHHHKHK